MLVIGLCHYYCMDFVCKLDDILLRDSAYLFRRFRSDKFGILDGDDDGEAWDEVIRDDNLYNDDLREDISRALRTLMES